MEIETIIILISVYILSIFTMYLIFKIIYSQKLNNINAKTKGKEYIINLNKECDWEDWEKACDIALKKQANTIKEKFANKECPWKEECFKIEAEKRFCDELKKTEE